VVSKVRKRASNSTLAGPDSIGVWQGSSKGRSVVLGRNLRTDCVREPCGRTIKGTLGTLLQSYIVTQVVYAAAVLLFVSSHMTRDRHNMCSSRGIWNIGNPAYWGLWYAMVLSAFARNPSGMNDGHLCRMWAVVCL
jgi:hypothetical protein